MVTTRLETKLLAGGDERLTPFLIFSCTVAASGGLLFGYDLGISGGVTSTETFLKKFFPDVYIQMKEDSKISNYCKFDSQVLTLFTSSLYIAGFFSSLFASHVSKRFGHRSSMRAGGAFFVTGAAMGAAAINVQMLLLSRLLLGIGVGFTNQVWAIPLYLSEIAPASYRGAIMNFFDACVNVGILIASLINYCTQKIDGGWGWRLSLGLAGIPAFLFAAGSHFIPETPRGIIQRGGHLQQASLLLQKLRGTADIGNELNIIAAASDGGKNSTPVAFQSLIVRRKYRPHLAIAFALPIFRQMTGINLVTFYAPVMFRTIGFKESGSLLSTVVTRMTVIACNLVSIAAVDRIGRRFLFFLGGTQMFASQLMIGGLMAAEFGDHRMMSKAYANIILVFLCVYVAGFGLSWGPLPWLATEIFPAEVRSPAQSIAVAASLLFTALVAQSLLWMLCNMKWGIFVFFGGWVAVMSLFVFFFLPETKGIPLEHMGRVWGDHWYWKSFVEDDEQ
ncbi:Hexose carrier protein HEX6 [Apostasia shenzhenica]|uniref:Hexose carrier protein HEX6 n=1 Tax=Apostasia shenzhenica TaxID=1088818 RepID=A0A2I0B8M7_9ASPA|nr:Hexose carrier protein HEX6 [Apostasia shenzhenica]